VSGSIAVERSSTVTCLGNTASSKVYFPEWPIALSCSGVCVGKGIECGWFCNRTRHDAGSSIWHSCSVLRGGKPPTSPRGSCWQGRRARATPGALRARGAMGRDGGSTNRERTWVISYCWSCSVDSPERDYSVQNTNLVQGSPQGVVSRAGTWILSLPSSRPQCQSFPLRVLTLPASSAPASFQLVGRYNMYCMFTVNIAQLASANCASSASALRHVAEYPTRRTLAEAACAGWFLTGLCWDWLICSIET
jgi:hypothetical protein